MSAPDPFAAALERLRAGGLVAFPTETVWGLAARASDDAALQALRAWKGRDAQQPVSILVTGSDALRPLAFEVPAAAATLMQAFWPGPLTLVLRCGAGFAHGVARGDGAVGVRCSPHPAAAALALAAQGAALGPLTATSLNRSGEPACRTRGEARALCAGPGAPFHLDAFDDAAGGEPSSVVDLTGARPRLLRAGAISQGEIDAALRRHPSEEPA